MKLLFPACFVILVLQAGQTQSKSLSKETDAALTEDIKRLLGLLEEERDLNKKSHETTDTEGETESSRDRAVLKQLESYLMGLGQPVAAGGAQGDQISKAGVRQRIAHLVEISREMENTVFIDGGVVRKPGHAEASEYIQKKEWQQGDDIHYSPDQLAPNGVFDKRKVIDYNLWPNGIMPWYFDPALTDASTRDTITKAAQRWEDVTCLKLPYRNSSHTKYLKIGSYGGCWSYLGPSGSGPQQKLSIGNGCEYHGIVMHELGHALGLVHEQSRQDRNEHVTINFGNIQTGMERNFAISRANNYAEYDLNSVMHYGTRYFSKNGLQTITVNNPDEHPLIGNRAGLTPYDIMSASEAYQCADHCKNDVLTPVCLNGGFLVKDCTCHCPEGLGGPECSTTDPTWSKCGGVFDLDLTTSPSVDFHSPNYPSPYASGTKCAWVFKTSLKGYLIELKVIALDMYGGVSTCDEFVEVRKNLPMQTGIRLCGTNSNGSVASPVYTLTTKPVGMGQMSVLLMSLGNVAPRQGFKAVASLKQLSACWNSNCSGLQQCEDNGSTTQFRCFCPAGLLGPKCDQIFDAPLKEDFEDERHMFIGWGANVGQTPSSNTGPDGDHTTGKGTYMFYETSYPVAVSDSLNMESLVNFQSGIQRCLDFAYHMYGRTMGTLEVKLRVDGVLQSSNLFQKIGDLGNQWLVEKLVIPKQKGTSYKIVFVGIKGSSYTSDIAVDDIVVEPCGINPVKSTPKPVITKAPRPATTKAPRPATTPAPRPATTKAPRPASTRTPLPASTLTPRPATTKAPRPASTRTPLPASTLAPRPATTKAPRPASTRTPLPASTLAPRPATTKVPRPATTKAPRPMTTNAPPVPYNDKPIMVYTRPLMCNFEEDLEDCFLSNSRDDRTDFVRTDSCFGTTSPCLDHTTGKGYYLVFRAEFSVPDDQGSLNSPWMVFEKKQVCFGGFFQSAGASSAKILVQKLDYKHVDIEYPMTISWQWEEWNTTITISGPFRIVLIASSHGDDTASVSVDDMYISPGKCNKTPRPVPTTARPVTSRPSTVFPKPTTKPNALFMTDFDGNGGDFHDEVGFFSWSANIGETTSRGTGPASDHTTGAGRYMYVEVSTPRRTGDVFKMVSDDVQTSTDFVCLTFWLSAQGRHLGEFRAQIVDAHSYNIYDEVINAPYSPGNTDWAMKSLQAHVMKGEVRIVFMVTRERWSGDYAVDDVTLKADTCPSV